jgi:hypothetical protein
MPATPQAPATTTTPKFAGVTFSPRVRTVAVTKKGVAAFRLSSTIAARGTLVLSVKGKKLGQVSFSLSAGKPKTFAVKLTRAGLKLLKKHHGRLAIAAAATAGKKTTTAHVTLRLRA